jgi:tetratricopeptide (TPR) repeat protein
LKSAKNKSVQSSLLKSENITIRFQLLIIFLFSFILYANTLNNSFVLDDYSTIEGNWLVKKGVPALPELLSTSYRHGFWTSDDELYRPLSLITFAILWEAFPKNPFPFHLINVLMFSFTSLLLFRLLLRMIPAVPPVIPFAAILLYIAHPVHTEVVANIKSLDEILAFFFMVLSVSFIYKFIDSRLQRFQVYSLIAFSLALMSKESAIIYIILLPLILHFFTDLDKKNIIRISTVNVIPAAIYLIVRQKVLGGITATKKFVLLDNVIAHAPDLMTRWATSFSLLLKYLWLLVFPAKLSCDYAYPETILIHWNNISAIISMIFHLGIFIYAIIYIRSKSILSFCILFYLISMAVYSNIFLLIGSPFAERFLYMSSFPFCLILSFTLFAITTDKSKKKTGNYKFIILIILILYSVKTISRNNDWKTDFTLYHADVLNTPNSARIHYFLGSEYKSDKVKSARDEVEKEAYLNKSLEEFQTAISLYPDYAEAYSQIGLIYYRKGNKQKAFDYYNKAIELKSTSALTLNNAGVLFSESGQHTKALPYYLKAVKHNPYNADSWKNLGRTYFELKDYNKAINAYQQELKYKPEDKDGLHYLSLSLKATGRHQ